MQGLTVSNLLVLDINSSQFEVPQVINRLGSTLVPTEDIKKNTNEAQELTTICSQCKPHHALSPFRSFLKNISALFVQFEDISYSITNSSCTHTGAEL